MAECEEQIQPISNEDPEMTAGYKAPAQKTVAELAELDADDEALVKYKATLLGSTPAEAAPADDPRRVIVEKMVLISPGRDDLVFDLTSLDTVKGEKHIIKEGISYKLKIVFKVHHEIVAGLKFHNVISRKGITCDKETHMVGSFPPKIEAHEFTTKEEDMPKGMVARGHYKVKSKFVDDDKKTHLAWEWQFDLKNEWAKVE